jgi:ribosomal-protein-alanine N-acetyltransferase
MRHLSDVLSIEASSFTTPWSKKAWVEEMRNPFAYSFVTRWNDITDHPLVGFICFRNIGDESELFNLCVHPQYRQLGIGRNILQFYFDFCHQMKIRTFYLEVNATNQAAIRLYQTFSYQMVGKRKKFYEGQYDAFLMLKRAE